MDALTSQANIAGYKAVLVAANTFERLLPDADHGGRHARPAEVLVLGAGVAGLQAIGRPAGWAPSSGRTTSGPAARAEIESLGADVPRPAAGRRRRPARAATPERSPPEQQAQRKELGRARRAGTTWSSPPRRCPGGARRCWSPRTPSRRWRRARSSSTSPPGPLGGNVALSEPGRTIVTDNGVTIVGAGNLPRQMPTAASTAYSRNISRPAAPPDPRRRARDRPGRRDPGRRARRARRRVVHPATAACWNRSAR